MRHSLKRLWYEVPLFRVMYAKVQIQRINLREMLEFNDVFLANIRQIPYSMYIHKTQIENATQVRSRR